ncbi:YqiR family transcription regulator [Gracilibacillus halophilus YIM-C55.5]|uniref:YqiR family transcription regulator n=1 Tax=Gracilibacillus halophilus YIM-C55.5 TaxID=1308866 RepID=N4WWG2_9BACI|nr:sigma-54-dependent Fis family transcriptional regulator [Gracilibacillus halophilus]ENH97416.1 YqiR family transcription regulator [Gracilibacillus halophilus YIM-C55.5]
MSTNYEMMSGEITDQFFAKAPSGFMLIDKNYLIYSANRQAQLLLNTTEEQELIGKPFGTFLSLQPLEEVVQGRKELHTEQTNENGQRLLLTYFPLFDEHRTLHRIGLIIEEANHFNQKVEKHTDYMFCQQALHAITQQSEAAVRILASNGSERYTNHEWEQIRHQQINMKKIHAQLTKALHQRRGYQDQFVNGQNIYKMQIEPFFSKGKLLGFVQMLITDEHQQFKSQLHQMKQVIRHLEKNYKYEDIIGTSSEILIAKEQAKLFSKTTSPILIRGETGVGKAMFARVIHSESEQGGNKFVKIATRSLSRNDQIRNLFGDQDHTGWLTQYTNGTIYIDELSELTIKTQENILYWLDQSTPSQRPNMIFGTTLSLADQWSSNFYKPLLERLQLYQIALPPLRERKEDIESLTTSIIERLNDELNKNVTCLSDETKKLFLTYRWPGNVAELESMMRQTFVRLAENEEVIQPEHIPSLAFNQNKVVHTDQCTLQASVDQYEKQYILQALDQYQYNKTKTAKALGISIRNLYYKMDRHQIDREVR